MDTSRRAPILLVGGTGVIGRRLLHLLVQHGHHVFGTTRSADRARFLSENGSVPMIVDALDADAVASALHEVQPALIVNLLTDLSNGFGPEKIAATLARNALTRANGTRNLVQHAVAAGVERMISASIAWIYEPGAGLSDEDAALDLAATGLKSVTVNGVVELEDATLLTPGLQGAVLRMGHLYGPGTGAMTPDPPAVHVDAAASAAFLAVRVGAHGAYNVVEPNGLVSAERLMGELGWRPGYRLAGFAE